MAVREERPLGAGDDRRPAGGLHGHPPLTPAAVLLRSRLTVPLLALAFLVLAALAFADNGSVLRTWDRPVQEWVESSRTDLLDDVFHGLSQLGGITVVATGLVVLLVLVYRRCHSLGTVLVAAVLARPLLEWVLKAAVDRPRPALERLVDGTGPSFPSGHVMAAIAFWGLVPPVVALLTRSRRWWWASVVTSGVIVVAVAASRMYLGVHWLSDVVGAMVLGSLYLLGVEYLLEWHHDRRGCVPLDDAESSLLAGMPRHENTAGRLAAAEAGGGRERD